MKTDKIAALLAWVVDFKIARQGASFRQEKP
jgi:hypothetical protein